MSLINVILNQSNPAADPFGDWWIGFHPLLLIVYATAIGAAAFTYADGLIVAASLKTSDGYYMMSHELANTKKILNDLIGALNLIDLSDLAKTGSAGIKLQASAVMISATTVLDNFIICLDRNGSEANALKAYGSTIINQASLLSELHSDMTDIISKM